MVRIRAEYVGKREGSGNRMWDETRAECPHLPEYVFEANAQWPYRDRQQSFRMKSIEVSIRIFRQRGPAE